jgi:hypothetical protein
LAALEDYTFPVNAFFGKTFGLLDTITAMVFIIEGLVLLVTGMMLVMVIANDFGASLNGVVRQGPESTIRAYISRKVYQDTSMAEIREGEGRAAKE